MQTAADDAPRDVTIQRAFRFDPKAWLDGLRMLNRLNWRGFQQSS
jgi:hypothetical protein